MINILIADDNIYYARTLMDVINSSMKDVRVVNITIDGKETIDKINNNNDIDIILLDLKMPIFSGIDILNRLTNDKRKKYNNSILVISGEQEMIVQVRDDDTVYDYINKICSMSDILQKIDKLVKYKSDKKNIRQVKGEIIKELQELGYNLSHKGTIYLLDAIYIAYTKKLQDELNLKKNIYPIISQKYNRPVHCIKSDIVKATNFMDSSCDLNKKKEYFSFADNSKPTVKLVIYTILNNLQRELKGH